MAKKPPLILDANIISRALATNQTEAYAKLFKKYENQYSFWVTGYTQYELQRSSSTEHQKATREYIAQNLTLVELAQPIMDFSARVFSLYAKHPSTKGLKISDGDIVNAACAIIKGAPVMTIDNNDYPRPFFIDENREHVRYSSNKNREMIDTVYILTPDMTNIKHCFEQHNL